LEDPDVEGRTILTGFSAGGMGAETRLIWLMIGTFGLLVVWLVICFVSVLPLHPSFSWGAFRLRPSALHLPTHSSVSGGPFASETSRFRCGTLISKNITTRPAH
jgi:hypothetical protein